MSNVEYVERPPRLQPELPQGEYRIPDPPEAEKPSAQPLIQVFLPLMTALGYVLLALMGQGRNLLIMLPMTISLVASVGVALYSRFRAGKGRGANREAYRETLVELRKEMTTQHDIQRRFYMHTYPDSPAALRIAYTAQRRQEEGDAASRLGIRLWERRSDDPDFGTLRLGVGTRPSTVVYKLSDELPVDDDRLARDAMRLAHDSLVLADAPVTISLNGAGASQESVVSQSHAIGVVGPDPKAAYSFVDALLVHYTALHAPTDARLLVLGDHERREAWRWLGRLPHARAERPEDTLCFESPGDRQGERDQNKAAAFLRRLRSTLEERQMRLRDEGEASSVDRPLLLLVVDLLAPLPDGSVLADLESDPGISMVVNEGAALGAAVLFLVPDLGQVPSGCGAVIELTTATNGGQGDRAGGRHNPTAHDSQVGQKSSPGREESLLTEGEVGFRYAQVGLNTPRYAGTADLITNAMALEQYAGHLELLRVRESYGADLPRGVLMQNLLGFSTTEELRQQLLENWQRSVQPDQADWLNAALGQLSGGDVRRLKFSADADGVHGLIAGSTGSGKSELLMTMILGLAYNYDPTIVNFVLVDFKGGAAFEPFRNLPHCVDIVTNLGGNAVERMFAAIMAEIHRREAINVATGSKHIVHYRKNGLHRPPYGSQMMVKGETVESAPYPHLFIFIDEFAEMIAENPEYKAQLNSITRLGRALGVTLILAAQRPTGVTDQMRANIKFRIALRVETREESAEVLRRPDAAYLPTGIPGRGYLQVGNEDVELIQVAWTGAEYRGGVKEVQPDVIWHDRPRKAAAANADEAPKVFEVMVDAMAELAREHSLPQSKPWPDFLPGLLSLQTPLHVGHMSPEGLNTLIGDGAAVTGDEEEDEAAPTIRLNGASARWLRGDGCCWAGVDWENKAMRAVVGLIDDPHHAEQMPLVVDLRRGHAVVFGASGWGKTTFLRTLITTLVTTHSPQELHAYILDFGGRQLSVFRDLPHVGAVITPDEEERVTRLLRQLDRALEERKAALSSARADDLYSYNRAHPEKALPAILLVIDNLAEYRESFDNLMPALISLARESRAYGIHIAVSAERPGSLGAKLYSLFTERFALKLSDPTEYTGIVGRGAHAIDDLPGRGYVKVGRQALAFQTALPVRSLADGQDLDDTQQLGYMVRLLRETAADLPPEGTPKPVHTLATRVLLGDLLPSATADATAWPVLGIDDTNLEPWPLNLATQGPHCMVVGPPNSGKTTTLRSLVLSWARSNAPEQAPVILVDYQRRLMRYGGRQTLADLPHVVAAVTDNQELVSAIEALAVETERLGERRRRILVAIDGYDTFADEARELPGALDALGQMARQWGTEGLHFVVAGSPSIARSPEELRKQVQMPRLGVALQTEEAVVALNGRIPRSLAQAELPPGRAFVVRSGRTFMVQIATPYEDDQRQAERLDQWTQEIRELYPGQQASWWQPPEEQADASEGEDDRTDGEASQGREGRGEGQAQPTGPGMLSAVPEGVDLDALKEKLLQAGMDGDLMAMLSSVDLVNVARELEIPVVEEDGE
jgi:DNA segregation ATPase FtsK/SpoIIIE-like protein